jgi:hypothetical protein
MKNLKSTFAIGPCIILQSHLIKPAAKQKFGNGKYSVTALVNDQDAQTIQAMCEALIERAFPNYTSAQKSQLRIPGDYHDKSGRMRFRLKLLPQFGKPEVMDMQSNLIVEELPNCSTAFLAGSALGYTNFGGGVWLAVTHVIVEQLAERKSIDAAVKALRDEKASPVKPGQSFMEYLEDDQRSRRRSQFKPTTDL